MHPDQTCQMRMGFDTTRYYDLPRGIDYAARLGSRVINAYGNDLLAIDSDAPMGGALRSDYLASPDQDIEHGYSFGLFRCGRSF